MTLLNDEVHVAYCREARRLRWVHAHRPVRMLRAIADLSARYDTLRHPSTLAKNAESERTVVQPASKPNPSAASPRPIFAEMVSSELTQDLLTYSRRQALLSEAQRLGIGRFEANLLIAEAQHRVRVVAATVRRVRRFPLRFIALILAAESLAALALYHLLV